MASTKISALTDLSTALAAADLAVVVDDSAGETKKVSITDLFGNVPVDMKSGDAAGPAVLNEAASDTNPTLVPDKSDLTLGIGAATNRIAFVVAGVRNFAVSNVALIPGAITMDSGTGNRPQLRWDTNATATVPGYTWQNDTDTGVGRAAADQLSLIAGAVEGIRVNTTSLNTVPSSGATLNVQVATTTVTTSSGSSVTASNLIPDGAVVLTLSTRVTTEMLGPVGYDVGDGSDVDRWGNSIAGDANTTSDNTDWTSTTIQVFTSANNVVITSDGVDFTAGVIRIVVHYIDGTAPTS